MYIKEFHVTRVGMAELRMNLRDCLKRVAAGEEIEIVRRGTVVARISPSIRSRRDARKVLGKLRARAVIGDVESPVAQDWEASRGPA